MSITTVILSGWWVGAKDPLLRLETRSVGRGSFAPHPPPAQDDRGERAQRYGHSLPGSCTKSPPLHCDSKAAVKITRVDSGGSTEAEDTLVVEEPLEIRVGEKPVSVTLRTPGDDFDLAAGFLFTESILRDRDDVESIATGARRTSCASRLRDGVRVDLQRLQRHFYSTSSCGVCGKVSIDALRVQTSPIARDAARRAAR